MPVVSQPGNWWDTISGNAQSFAHDPWGNTLRGLNNPLAITPSLMNMEALAASRSPGVIAQLLRRIPLLNRMRGLGQAVGGAINPEAFSGINAPSEFLPPGVPFEGPR